MSSARSARAAPSRSEAEARDKRGAGATVLGGVLGVGLSIAGYACVRAFGGAGARSKDAKAATTAVVVVDSVVKTLEFEDEGDAEMEDGARGVEDAKLTERAIDDAAEAAEEAVISQSSSPRVSENIPPSTIATKESVTTKISPSNSIKDSFPAPLTPRARPALKLEVENTSSRGATFVASLGIDEFSIGRGKVNALVVESAEASTVHASVRWTGKTWEVRDLGSLNGTYLNQTKISIENERAPGKWHKLQHGDAIQFGERESSPKVSVSFFRDMTKRAHEALSLRAVVRAAGSKPNGSEDRILVECPIRGNPSVGVFCVFDGHGGFVAAESARKIFPEVLARHLSGKVPDEKGARTLLERVFLETDKIMGIEYEGCTATAVLVWKNPRTGGLTMQAANVGDSSAALGRVSVSDKSAHGAKYLTPEHKVRHKEERDRLNEAGAELPPEATRLYGLALSRALGDKFLKDQNVGLIAHPFVSEPIDVNGTTDNAVLTIASDGIWDVITPEEMYDAMYDEKIDGCLHATAQRMVIEARRKRSVDDISFIGVCLDI